MLILLVFYFGGLCPWSCTSNSEVLRVAGEDICNASQVMSLRVGREVSCGFGKLQPHSVWYHLKPFHPLGGQPLFGRDWALPMSEGH